ncbi:MAG: desulfoferrodoxin [Chloroflexi bacterium]|nr:desulfoferrodoxin [Chloroflexota bacterium]
MATQTGKRYVCGTCGSEMLATKAGTGELTCCGKPMELKAAAK